MKTYTYNNYYVIVLISTYLLTLLSKNEPQFMTKTVFGKHINNNYYNILSKLSASFLRHMKTFLALGMLVL